MQFYGNFQLHGNLPTAQIMWRLCNREFGWALPVDFRFYPRICSFCYTSGTSVFNIVKCCHSGMFRMCCTKFFD